MNYQENEQLRNIKREVEMWKKINNHSNIIRLFDWEIHESFVLILMELACEGTLLEMINNRVEPEISENVALYIIREITLGILHMHSQSPPIAHRDIKIENVLRVGNNYKLCDFGSTSVDTLDPRKESKTTVLENFSKFEKMTTFIYRPPEMCDPYSKFPIYEKVDIWMLGCILFAILFKTHPFLDAQKLTIINAHYYIPDNTYSEKIVDFMRLMLTPNPVNRPSAREVLNLIADWKNIKTIELPSETQEIKSKHLNQKSVKANNSKSMLTADDIYRVQQEIMKDQMKKNRYKRKNDDDDDLNEIFEDLDVAGGGVDTQNKKNTKDANTVKKAENVSPGKDKINSANNFNNPNSNSNKPFGGFDMFDNKGNFSNDPINKKGASADWMIDFNQGFSDNKNNKNNPVSGNKSSNNFDNNFGFDFLDDIKNSSSSNSVKKNDTFGDLDNVFSNVSGTSNQNIQNNANSKLNNNNSSLSNQGAGFDFDKFNNSNSNQMNNRGLGGNSGNINNFNNAGNNANFGNNFTNTLNNFSNNDPFFGNAFSNSNNSNNFNNPGKSPINLNTNSKINNQINSNNGITNNSNISPNATRNPPMTGQNLNQKQGVNINKPKGEQNILDFFK